MRKLLSIIALLPLALGAAEPVYLDESKPLDERVEDALSRMTLREKAAMLHAEGKFASAGVPRLGIPDLWMSDGPHGVRAEINWQNWGYAGRTNDSITAFPALTALAATWNPALSEAYGNALGEEALYREKDIMLGPGVNIYRTPLSGRNFEYMGEDPYLASVMVVPYIKGMQRNGVASCVKHFALNNQERWRGHIDVEVSDRALHEIYLPAFKAAVVDGGAWSVMGAYNKYKGFHNCHNPYLNKILKDDWKFDGVFMTDWGGCHDTDEAANNGLDLEMGTFTNGLTSESAFTTDCYYLADPYIAKLEKGELPVADLDDKVRRLLRLNFLTAMNRRKPFGSAASPEHYAVAEAIGNEAIVLLKNAPAGKKKPALLPLPADFKGRILVVGDNATRNLMAGGGSSELKPKDIVTPLDGIRAVYGPDVKYARGYRTGKPMYGHVEEIPAAIQDSLRAEAVDMARDADVVIFVGGLNKNHLQDCEDGDRVGYDLPFGQPELIRELAAVNPDMIVVLLSGNAVQTDWSDRVPAILQGWYLGSMAGKSIASVLSGAVNPSGKLPFSFPARLEDCGAHAFGEISYPGDSIRQKYAEDILVGYRWHDTRKIPAAFPFGHGLSYTRFAYGKPEISAKTLAEGDSLTVSVPVRNVGDRAGKETVQLYISQDRPTIMRAVKELKGFEKISLAPGEEKTVTFRIGIPELSYYDESTSSWAHLPGTYKALIGSSSTDLPVSVTFKAD